MRARKLLVSGAARQAFVAPRLVILTVMSLEALIGAGAMLAARRQQKAPSPAVLARWLDPRFVITATIALLSDITVRWVREPNQRDVVSTPPRTGKSQTLVVWMTVWALAENPDLEIVVISHSDDLAKEHSGKARKIIQEYGDRLGYAIASDKTAVGRWRIEGREGSMLAAGFASGVTGFGADLLVIDDIVKDAAQADSETRRKAILAEYQGSLANRIHPGGSCMIVMTRWHEEDLAGAMLDQEPDRWRHTNIPAISERNVPDALGRPPGVVMTSALGYTPEDYRNFRRTVGERMWYAQFMGVPSTPEGTLVKQAWFDDWRMACAPTNPVMTVVSIDPADSGKGDECGLVATSRTAGNVIALIADKSARMTSDEWATAAVDLAIEVGASQIAVEGFSARETYTRMVRKAIEVAQVKGRLRHGIKVSSWPEKGKPRPGDAIARSGPLLQALETGTARLAGHFAEFEAAAIAWQRGQHQPDRLAAWVVGHDVLVNSVGKSWDIAVPGAGALPGGAGSVVVLDDWMRQRVG